MQLDPEEVKHLGAGQMLGRVMESGAVESMAMGAGFSGLVALMELGLAGSVLVMLVSVAAISTIRQTI